MAQPQDPRGELKALAVEIGVTVGDERQQIAARRRAGVAGVPGDVGQRHPLPAGGECFDRAQPVGERRDVIAVPRSHSLTWCASRTWLVPLDRQFLPPSYGNFDRRGRRKCAHCEH